MKYAFFNQYGDCTGITECEFEPLTTLHFVEVDDDSEVDDIWYDHDTCTVVIRDEVDPFDSSYDVGTVINLEPLSGCAYFLNGAKSADVLHFDKVGPVFVQIKGRHKLAKWIDVQDYAAKRVADYPSFAEQFDVLYHGGYEAWYAMVDAVKSAHPKPDAT